MASNSRQEDPLLCVRAPSASYDHVVFASAPHSRRMCPVSGEITEAVMRYLHIYARSSPDRADPRAMDRLRRTPTEVHVRDRTFLLIPTVQFDDAAPRLATYTFTLREKGGRGRQWMLQLFKRTTFRELLA